MIRTKGKYFGQHPGEWGEIRLAIKQGRNKVLERKNALFAPLLSFVVPIGRFCHF